MKFMKYSPSSIRPTELPLKTIFIIISSQNSKLKIDSGMKNEFSFTQFVFLHVLQTFELKINTPDIYLFPLNPPTLHTATIPGLRHFDHSEGQTFLQFEQ
jgi:hypothetical protein